jgi:sugar transferase EpsL
MKHRRADAHVRPRADARAPAERDVGGQVREVTHHALVLDDARGVQDDAPPDAGLGVHHRHRHHHRALAQLCGGGHPGARVHEGAQRMPLRHEGLGGGFPSPVVAQRERHEVRRLRGEPRAVAQHRQPQHPLAARHEVVDEAFDGVPSRLHHLGDDASVTAGAQHEDRKCRHNPQYTEGVTRDQQLRLKRAVDVVGAAAGLALGAPVMLAAAAAIRASMGGPVLFRQQRPGHLGQPFHVYKFRTMSDARDAAGRLKPDAERLTRVGRFIRATSLDELPQLLNVLKGEMSLVGPRPLLMQYLGRYTPRQARRHEVKPGITGLAQVRGRNSLSWEEKFEYDVQYVEQWSLGLDARILLETLGKVVKRDGISQQGHATMSEFMGTKAP